MDASTTSALIAAGGGLAEGALSFIGQSKANKSNRAMAREQMAFQERLSSSAHQRSVQDMKAAGLNPLYYVKGGGASTPGGSLSVAHNPAHGIQGSTAKALQARDSAITKSLVDSQIKNLDAQNSQILSQTGLNLATAKEVAARTDAIQSGLPKRHVHEKGWQIVEDLVDKVGSQFATPSDVKAHSESRERPYSKGDWTHKRYWINKRDGKE